MFVDEIVVKLIAGNGGDGCTSFHHEKCMPNLGPDGGNGGRGASIIFEVEKGLKTLVDLRYHKIIKGDKGVNGKGSDRTGANAEDVIIKVPQGTTVTDAETGEFICDLVEDKQQFVVAKGGRGGKGNAAFATHDNPAPRISENGEPGEVKQVKCELKVLADVGLVGLPSVGKSTILSVISASKPKIAAYHFTTLNPNLGVVKLKDGRNFVMADLPGLIEGASEGLGLGLKFLRHASRTKVIAHVVDMGAEELRNPVEDFKVIQNEIEKYGHNLDKKKLVVIANKMDLPDAKDNLERFKKEYPNLDIIPISAYSLDGVEELVKKLADILDTVEPEEVEIVQEKVYKFEEEVPFTIEKLDDAWLVSGEKISRLFKMTKFNEEESVIRFAKKLKNMGVEEALEEAGAKRGDDVVIEDYVFQFKD
ncbi:MAG: GTPase ObgE [Firmicutes bacterium]|nr:GTPase ObgE [Bacillota bacterium]